MPGLPPLAGILARILSFRRYRCLMAHLLFLRRISPYRLLADNLII